MRFLLEVSGQYKREESKVDYFNMKDDDKIKIIEDALKNTPVDATQWAYYIIEDKNIYYEDNPIYKIALKLPDKNIGELSQETLIALADNDNPYSDTLLDSQWVSSADLYSDEDANTAFKIKALTLASKNKVDLKQFRSDERHWLSINKFKEVATNALKDFAKGAGKQSIYDWLLSKNFIGNVRSEDNNINRTNIMLFLINKVFPESSYHDNYIRFKNEIDNELKENQLDIVNVVQDFISKPYNQGSDFKLISDSLIKKLNNIEDLDLSRLNISKNKSVETQSDNQEEIPLVKKQAIEDLVSMKIDKEEATELVNKVYTPDILRDSLVKAAIKARNK